MKVKSFMRHADEFTPVEVELSLSPGLPQISFLGLPDPFIRESVTRIKSALRTQGFDFPKAMQVLVQLRPSYLKKTSRGLDLAVAAALIWETEQAKPPENLDKLNLYGELSLKGEVFVPDDVDDSEDCLSQTDVMVTGAKLANFNGTVWSLNELKDLSTGPTCEQRIREEPKCIRPKFPFKNYTQKQAELIKVLAAGGHSALLVGAPGSGKSATAESINSFLSEPSPDDWKAISKIASSFYKKPSWRPHVAVHHTITPLAMTGGGGQIKPGEITRAHFGTLIMDELLEFKPQVQDSIREPLENGYIEIARQGRNQKLPADFQLIATSNLCRCGNYFPKDRSTCRCRNHSLRQYQERFSGPIIDRFAVIGLFNSAESNSTKSVKADEILKSINLANQVRLARGQNKSNSRLTLEDLEKVLGCDDLKIQVFDPVIKSNRARTQIMQIARTLADLDGSQKTERGHFDRAHELVCKSREELLKSLDV